MSSFQGLRRVPATNPARYAGLLNLALSGLCFEAAFEHALDTPAFMSYKP
jgi:hypothetical protein